MSPVMGTLRIAIVLIPSFSSIELLMLILERRVVYSGFESENDMFSGPEFVE